jgi:hypothetical protein
VTVAAGLVGKGGCVAAAVSVRVCCACYAALLVLGCRRQASASDHAVQLLLVLV